MIEVIVELQHFKIKLYKIPSYFCSMESLNEIITRFVDATGDFLKSKNVTVEYDFDPHMPQVYRFGTPDYLLKMLSELTGEQSDAAIFDTSLTKLRYSTLSLKGVQIVVIEHNGKPLPSETIAQLNRQLDQIYINWETVNPGGRGGNRRAAIQISPFGGRISIENHPDREYKVETTVEIPTYTV